MVPGLPPLRVWAQTCTMWPRACSLCELMLQWWPSCLATMSFVRALASAPPPWVTAPAQSKQDATPHAEDHPSRTLVGSNRRRCKEWEEERMRKG